MRKLHIVMTIILLLFTTFQLGCSINGTIQTAPKEPELPTIEESITEWTKNSEIYKITDAGPAKAPFNVSMFVKKDSSYKYSKDEGIEFEIEILNTTTVPYYDFEQDLTLLGFTPSITIKSEEQINGSSKEYIIKKILPELKDVVLMPGESYSIKWVWNHTDMEGKSVDSGFYLASLDYLEDAIPITYKGEDGKPAVQQNYQGAPFVVAHLQIK